MDVTDHLLLEKLSHTADESEDNALVVRLKHLLDQGRDSEKSCKLEGVRLSLQPPPLLPPHNQL